MSGVVIQGSDELTGEKRAIVVSPKGELKTAIVNDSGASQAHNRFIENVAETQALLGHMTWDEIEDVTSIRFKLLPGAGSTPPAVGDIVHVVFDAAPVDDTTDDSQAWSWLQPVAASENLDVEYNELTYIPKTSLVDAESGWSRWFEFGAALRRADFLFVDGNGVTTNINILAEVG